MLAEEQKDWSVYKQIFADHWDGFKKKYPRYNSEYYDDLVEKMLKCGDPKQMGYIEYLCTTCGKGRRLVSMSCKSFLCLRCGKVYVDDWVSQVSKMLHPGIIYRHIVLTIPKVFREIFYRNAQKLLGPLFRCGVDCLDDFYSSVSRKKLRGGYIVVLQTHGRNGQYNVHLHIIATSGGLDAKESKWGHLGYLPYHLLHKKWQWYLLEMLKRELKTGAIKQLVDDCYNRYPNGFVANVQKGDVPSRYQSLSKYLAKYVVTPPISVRRIDAYSGDKVTYHYRSHRSGKVEYDVVSVYVFIGRMIQHVFAKGFKRIRYYGVQATKTFEKFKGIIKAALAIVKEVVQDAVKIIPQKNYRERYQESTGKDPLICFNCGEEMVIWKIWHPVYGVIYDKFEEIKRGVYESEEKKGFIEQRDGGTIWSSSQGIQLSLFNMWRGASC